MTVWFDVGFDGGLLELEFKPLFQTNRVPEMMQVNFFDPTTAVNPIRVQLPPAFAIAAFAEEADT